MFKLTVPLVLQVLKKRKVDDAQRKERAAARKERKVRVDATKFEFPTVLLRPRCSFAFQRAAPAAAKDRTCCMLDAAHVNESASTAILRRRFL